jgi:hypothetical protein
MDQHASSFDARATAFSVTPRKLSDLPQCLRWRVTIPAYYPHSVRPHRSWAKASRGNGTGDAPRVSRYKWLPHAHLVEVLKAKFPFTLTAAAGLNQLLVTNHEQELRTFAVIVLDATNWFLADGDTTLLAWQEVVPYLVCYKAIHRHRVRPAH